jgi:predicted PurR-regulated permease PerM
MSNNDSTRRFTFDRVVRLVITGIILAAVFALVDYLSNVLIPFAAAVLLAYLLNPLVARLERGLSDRKHARGLAVGITLLGLMVTFAASCLVVVPLVASQFERFGEDFTKLRDDISESLRAEERNSAASPEQEVTVAEAENDEAESAPETKTKLGYREMVQGWRAYRDAPDRPREERFAELLVSVEGTYIGQAVQRLVAWVQSEEFDAWVVDAAKQVVRGGWSMLTFLLDMLLGLTVLIIIALYLIFLLLDYPAYVKTWRDSLPPAYGKQILSFVSEFEKVMRQYFRGQTLIALIMGLLFAIGFSLIGLPLAVPLGLFVGLLNMVPYLQTVGLVPALILALLKSIESESSVVWSIGLTLMVFAVAQLIQDSIIVPRVMGRATGLRPVAVMLGVFIWGKLLGFLGLLLAIPLTCLGIAYYRRVVLNVPAEAVEVAEDGAVDNGGNDSSGDGGSPGGQSRADADDGASAKNDSTGDAKSTPAS